jgi:SagB-type dehydrogenase family enzyme
MMAAAVESDPQFRIPHRPTWIGGVVRVGGDPLVVDGTGERRKFRGRAAVTLLPRLIPLLDGSRDLSGLGLALPDVRGTDLKAAVALLYTSGLVVEAGPEASDGRCPAPVRDFLGRHLDTTRAHVRPADAIRGLTDAVVRVLGPAPAATGLVEALAACGVAGTPAPPGSGLAGVDLAVGLDDGSDPPWLARLDDDCAAAGVPWLRIGYRPGAVELGPRFDRRYTACYRCLRAAQPATTTDRDRQPPAGWDWWPLAAREVVFLLSRVGHPASLTPAGYTVLDLAEWRTEQHLAPRRAGCPDCVPAASGTPRGPGQDDFPLAYCYEQAVTFPVAALSDPKVHQQHYRPANIELQTDHRSFDSAPRLALPMVNLADIGPGRPVAAESQLPAVLLAAFGLRPGGGPRTVSRYAPSGGNLGSPQAFVLVRDVGGVPPGLYAYDVRDHALSKLSDGADPADLGDPPAGGPEPAAVVVVTAAVGRLARKYQLLALRISCLDSGVALQQMRAVCGEVELGCELVEHWDDDRVARLLGVDRRGEPVLGMAVITNRRTQR